MNKTNVMVLAALAAMGVQAAIEPVSPKDGATLPLLFEVQKKIMAIPSYDGRLAALQADAKIAKKENRVYGRHGSWWRRAQPLVLKWNATEGEKGPWKVELGKAADLSDAKVYYYNSSDVEVDKKGWCKREISRANLEIGATYHWRVTGNVHCPAGKCNHDCSCRKGRKETASPIVSFQTDAQAPRWIAIEGSVGNIRDLGGRMTTYGKRVRQNMAFRGQGLNYNSVTGAKKGRNRLTVEDVEYFTEELGVKTDLDLRSARETADLNVSPLGPKVKFVLRSSPCYSGIFTEGGKKTTAANFRLFCDKANYPIYFHCIGGADRTGSLAYILNGVLGVDRHELETDWESTFYPTFPEMRKDYTGENFWCREQHFNNGFGKYGKEGDSWNRRIELYLLDCGVTQAEIDAFRAIMLEK